MQCIALFLTLCLGLALASPLNERIVNGDIAERGQFPYAVGLLLPTGVCGASLVSANYVLTAAQCINGLTSVTVVLGSTRIFDVLDEGQIRLEATVLKVHPGFEIAPDIFDVGLIQLPQSVPDFTPIRLPNLRQVDATFVGQQATIIGWGSTSNNGPQSMDLRYIRLQIISVISCRLGLPTQQITDNHICTDSSASAPCQGDYGGPLTLVDSDGITKQVGVFSFSSVLGCESNRPSVFTRMASYLQWIGDNSDVDIREGFE
ncbi:collagenase-like [Armigeres subalbatus]|uniref:collagenase-like n=1 Tax=Armigeres subalbatus TaxID=124917 RepID=UPI002ED04B4E